MPWERNRCSVRRAFVWNAFGLINQGGVHCHSFKGAVQGIAQEHSGSQESDGVVQCGYCFQKRSCLGGNDVASRVPVVWVVLWVFFDVSSW